MKQRLVPTVALVAYSALLVRIIVFKDMPTIRLGHLMFRFGGTDGGSPANLVPFKTIASYLVGSHGLIIGGANLLGNIALLVPVGLLIPLVYRNLTWKKCLAFAVAAGLVLEIMQVILHVGIFDIDDVILNALGVMVGFWMFRMFAKWAHPADRDSIVSQ